MIIALIAPYMVGNDEHSADLGPKVFFIWGACCVGSTLFAYFCVPEMKGLTLEQIDQMMEETSARESSRWRPTQTFATQMGRARPDIHHDKISLDGYRHEVGHEVFIGTV